MKIACLGWGSLVWRPGDLPVHGAWHCDGPQLPVEFCRESKHGRITLVVAPQAQPITVLWSMLKLSSLSEAITVLGDREDIPAGNRHRNIGVWSPNTACATCHDERIDAWGRAKGLDAVLWTALPAKYRGESGRMPTQDEVVAHLKGLVGTEREHAEEYVRKAPKQIRTAYRRAIEVALGWTPASNVFIDQAQDIIFRADRLHTAYYDADTFRGPSLYFHRRALEFRDDRDFNRYLEFIYATLTAWGMHRMGKGGSKMLPFQAFQESVAPLRETIRHLAGLKWYDLTYDKWSLLEGVFRGIDIMASETTLVGNSKVLAHMLPDLVPPIDRQYTLRYLKGRTAIDNNLDQEWALTKEIISEFFVPVSADPGFRAKAEAWIADQVQFPWDTSVIKVVDNLVIGAGKTRGALP